MIGWSAVFQAGLLIMTCLAQALPISSIPEQNPVTTMRLNVIHHSGFSVSSLSSTQHAKRMGGQILFAGFLPCATIAATRRASRFLRMEGAVLIAILPPGYQFRAAGMRTWVLRSDRHRCHLVAEAWLQTPAGIPRCKTQPHNPYRLKMLVYDTHGREPEKERGRSSLFAPIP